MILKSGLQYFYLVFSIHISPPKKIPEFSNFNLDFGINAPQKPGIFVFSGFDPNDYHRFNKTAYIAIYYTSNMVTRTDEYLVYDFSNILAALGGALGLFIGFSFYDCGSLIVDALEKKSNKKVKRLCEAVQNVNEECALRAGIINDYMV